MSAIRLTSIWGPDAAEFKPSRWLRAASPCKGQGLGPPYSPPSFLRYFPVVGDSGMLSSMDSEILTEVVTQPIGDASHRRRACAQFRSECTERRGGGCSAVPHYIREIGDNTLDQRQCKGGTIWCREPGHLRCFSLLAAPPSVFLSIPRTSIVGANPMSNLSIFGDCLVRF